MDELFPRGSQAAHQKSDSHNSTTLQRTTMMGHHRTAMLAAVLALRALIFSCDAFTASAPAFFSTRTMQRPNDKVVSSVSAPSVSQSRLFSTKVNEDIQSMRAGEIKKELESYGISTKAFLEKKEMIEALRQARTEGLHPRQPVDPSSRSSKSRTSSTSSDPPVDATANKVSREERIRQEILNCQSMKPVDLKKELEEWGVSTKSFFEKSEFVQALAAARVDNVKTKKGSDTDTNNNSQDENYAEYTNVEVLTDERSGPRPTYPKTKTKPAESPFGGSAASGMGGMGGMGGIADNPFGGANPFGGGSADAMGKAQQMMSNPKVQELMRKAQSNPRIMAKMQECMSNPAALLKYRNDPEVSELVREMQRFM
jgi:STI1 domain